MGGCQCHLSLSPSETSKRKQKEKTGHPVGRSVGRSLCAFILRVCTQVKRNIRKLQYCHTLVVVALFLSSAHADALQNLHLCLVEDEKEESWDQDLIQGDDCVSNYLDQIHTRPPFPSSAALNDLFSGLFRPRLLRCCCRVMIIIFCGVDSVRRNSCLLLPFFY